ncbi:hypothetical protein BC827DRAFT_1383745 [Russula dissimulans]|nr:hypothetical protein BC827DRAFT_1383745 [Russula dissimulans]
MILISALKRLLTSRPSLLGVSAHMYLDSVAGMVATAASVTVSNVFRMIGTEAGLSMQSVAMKAQCIDQLNKTDAPPIPEARAHTYLLGVEFLVSLSDAPQDVRFPSTTPSQFKSPPPVPASLCAHLAHLTRRRFQKLSPPAWEWDCGCLALPTPRCPRNGFLTALAKAALPPRVVAAPLPTPMTRSPVSLEGLTLGLAGGGGSGGPPQPPGLSQHNLACLRALVAAAVFLAGTLGPSWFAVLKALRNVDNVLTTRSTTQLGPVAASTGAAAGTPSKRGAAQSEGQMGTGQLQLQQQRQQVAHPLLADADPESVQAAMQRLFDGNIMLDHSAFHDFVGALCKLSFEMGLWKEDNILSTSTSKAGFVTSRSEQFGRRRVGGIHIPWTLRSGDSSIARLGSIAALNIQCLVYRSPDVAWDAITSHLLFILRHLVAPQPIRLQAPLSDLQAAVQRRILDVLSQQIMLSGTTSSSTTMELRRFGLETLHQILQAVCRPTPSDPALQSSPPSPEAFRMRPPPLTHLQEKGYSVLIKIAFQSMTLICDSLSALSPDHLRLCITTLGQFGRQADTNIALTAVESLFWGVSDAIHKPNGARRTTSLRTARFRCTSYWEILRLCDDARPEVRLGAIQRLFRTLQLYGATLSLMILVDGGRGKGIRTRNPDG